MWRTDRHGRAVRAGAWDRTSGAPGALEAPPGEDTVHPDDRATVREARARAAAQQTPLETQYRLLLADGTHRWMLDRARPTCAPDGTYSGHVGATVDVHEYVEAEEEAELLARVGALLGRAGDPERALDELAAVCSPLLGDHCAIVLDPEAAPLAAALVPQTPGELARRVEGPDGAAVLAPLAVRGSPFGVLVGVADPPRRLGERELRIAGAVADRIALSVDSARMLQAALGAQESGEGSAALLDAFLAAAPAGLAFFDTELRYLQINDVLAGANGVAPRAHLGRRPSALLGEVGARIEELVAGVLATGEPVADVAFSDVPDAAGRTRHWSAGLYPVRLGLGHAAGPEGVAGVGAVVADVTARVEADRARARLLERAGFLAEAAEALDGALDDERTLAALAEVAAARVATWCVVAVEDPDGRGYETVVAAHRDPALAALAREVVAGSPAFPTPGDGPSELRSGAAVLHAESALDVLGLLGGGRAGPDALARLGAASAIVAPLTARGRTLGTIVLVSADGRYDEDDAALARELGRRAGLAVDNARLYRHARREQRASAASRAILDAYIERAPIGFALLDGELRCRRVNARLCELDGLPAAAHLGRSVTELVPGIAREAVAALREVLATGVPRPDLPVTVADPRRPSARRHFLVSAYRVGLEDGEESGLGTTISEVTDRVQAESALRAQRDLYDTLLRAQSDMGEGFVLVEDSRILYVNAAAERIARRGASVLYALPDFLELFPADHHKALRDRIALVVARRRGDPGFETELLLPGGERRPIELAAQPFTAEGHTRLVVVVRDISERRREELERERLLALEQHARREIAAAHARTQLVAELAMVMDESMDLRTTLRRATQVLARTTADVAAIDVVAPGSESAQRMGRAARDPARDAVAVQLVGSTYPVDRAHPMGAALADGIAQLHPRLHPALMRAASSDPDQLAQIMQLLGTSMLVLPLSARGKVVGALMCSWDEGTALPTGAQLAHLEDVARRLALSVDNALLYAERAGIASALQAGLLPPRLPSIPGVSVAARYLPAGEAMEVGGDFYDVFAAGPDTWAVVVGDVCGKGAEAAAVTAMARYTLRTASLAGPSTPSGTLALLNAAMASERVPERFLTAVLAHLRLRPDGGGTLRVVAAGHPAPLVVRADGRIEAIPAGGALLGIVTGVRWEETRVDLEPGDGVVLYTDGVTEADRRAPLEPAALAALLPGRLGHPSAAGLAESVRRVAEERAGGRLRDDVAIVALLLDRR